MQQLWLRRMASMTTDITELARRVEHIISDMKLKHGDKDTYAPVMKWDEFLALVEALEKAQTINAAAEKLVRCKGRYHSEQNYRALAALFGVTTPDLPPLDDESHAVTVENLQESAYRAGLTAGWNLGLANNNDGFNKCLAAHAAGIKVEAE
ncbi:TPA: ead/Ea22-like family protein [Klebsiella pneumoniae]|nr:ead/Ea22-like family protein [Klebsiella pneumoniae]